MKMARATKTNRNEIGFTLIELVIVSVVIAILAGILIPIINVPEQLRMSRDSKRVSDMLKLHTSIANAVAGGYIQLTDTITTACGTCDSLNGTTAVDGTGWIQFASINGNDLRAFFPRLPVDPTNLGNYVFSYYSDGTYFELNCVLESQKYIPDMANDGGDNNDIYERGSDLGLNT